MLMYLAGLVSGVVLTVLSLAIWLWPDGTIRLPKIEPYRPAPWKPREPAPPPSFPPLPPWRPAEEPLPATSKLLD